MNPIIDKLAYIVAICGIIANTLASYVFVCMGHPYEAEYVGCGSVLYGISTVVIYFFW